MTAPVYTLGLDVSKAHLDACLLPDRRRRRVANSPAGHADLLAWLAPVTNPAELPIVLEASGRYHRTVHEACTRAGHPVAVVNPKHVRHFARSRGRLAKNDRLDADLIAQFGAINQPRPTPLPHPGRAHLAELLAYRQQLLDEIAQRSQQLPDYRSPTLQARATAHLEQLRRECRAVTAELAQARAEHPELDRLAQLVTTCPGVGPIFAAAVLAYLPELGQLSDKQIAALVGVAPIACDSGTLRGKRFIQGGRPHIRRILYLCALAAIRSNPPIRAFHQRLVLRGKPGKLAIVACMRKIIVTLNAMVRSNTPWKTIPLGP